jgi:hypothetical protein
MQEQKLIKVRTIDNHLVVERLKSEAGEPAPPPVSSAEREEALPALQETLIAYVDLLEMGIPEREVEALMRASDPEFDEEDYGFQEFGELLNLACDKRLVRVEADANETLRYYPGPDLNDPIAPIGPPAAKKAPPAPPRAARMAASGPPPAGDRDRDRDREEGGGRRRRRRRRRGGRGRGEGRADEPGPAGLPVLDDSELEEEVQAVLAEPVPEPAQQQEAEQPAAEEQETAAPDQEEEPEAAPKKAAKKKKSARKKATRKKAAKKAAPSDGDSSEE